MTDPSIARVLRSLPLPVGSIDIGREELKIADKRLSRKQVGVTVSADGRVSIFRHGANASFIQHEVGSGAIEIPRGTALNFPPQALLFLAKSVDGQLQYPARIIQVAATLDTTPVGAAAPLASVPSSGGPAGEWQVMLSGKYVSYEPSVQHTLEAAFASGAATADVTIRGSSYTISLRDPIEQRLRSDPSKVRPARRKMLRTAKVTISPAEDSATPPASVALPTASPSPSISAVASPVALPPAAVPAAVETGKARKRSIMESGADDCERHKRLHASIKGEVRRQPDEKEASEVLRGCSSDRCSSAANVSNASQAEHIIDANHVSASNAPSAAPAANAGDAEADDEPRLSASIQKLRARGEAISIRLWEGQAEVHSSKKPSSEPSCPQSLLHLSLYAHRWTSNFDSCSGRAQKNATQRFLVFVRRVLPTLVSMPSAWHSSSRSLSSKWVAMQLWMAQLRMAQLWMAQLWMTQLWMIPTR